MTTKAATRIGFYLLAAVLLAIQVPRTSLAEEAANQGGTVTSAPGSDSADHVNGTGDNGSAKTDTAKPDSTKPDSTKPDSGKSEVISPAGGREAGGKPEGVHSNAAVNDGSHFGQARDPGPVDAHIAPPRRHNDNRFSARDPKSRFKIGSSPRLRSGTGHTVTGHVTRNSIGLAVPPQPNKLDRDSKPAGPVVAPVANAPGVSAPAVKTEPTVEHTITAHPNVSASVVNGAAIGGNANIRRNSGPASIGGQTKTVAGINGSTIIHRIH
jgi:hypothetical protein